MPVTPDGIFIDKNGLTLWQYSLNNEDKFNVTYSELGHIFYTILGNEAIPDPNNQATSEYILDPDYENVYPDIYDFFGGNTFWMAIDSQGNTSTQNSSSNWAFNFETGIQYLARGTSLYPLAITTGPITLPEPTTGLLLLTGLLFITARRNQK